MICRHPLQRLGGDVSVPFPEVRKEMKHPNVYICTYVMEQIICVDIHIFSICLYHTHRYDTWCWSLSCSPLCAPHKWYTVPRLHMQRNGTVLPVETTSLKTMRGSKHIVAILALLLSACIADAYKIRRVKAGKVYEQHESVHIVVNKVG
jgi:hypothetical protein